MSTEVGFESATTEQYRGVEANFQFNSEIFRIEDEDFTIRENH